MKKHTLIQFVFAVSLVFASNTFAGIAPSRIDFGCDHIYDSNYAGPYQKIFDNSDPEMFKRTEKSFCKHEEFLGIIRSQLIRSTIPAALSPQEGLIAEIQSHAERLDELKARTFFIKAEFQAIKNQLSAQNFLGAILAMSIFVDDAQKVSDELGEVADAFGVTLDKMKPVTPETHENEDLNFEETANK